MNILKVKEQSGGNSLQVTFEDGSQVTCPKVNSNIEYELVKGWVSNGGVIEDEFTEDELLKQKQDKFRLERNVSLDKVDKAINIAEDLGQDSKSLRNYRQALRDATMTWVMPESVL